MVQIVPSFSCNDTFRTTTSGTFLRSNPLRTLPKCDSVGFLFALIAPGYISSTPIRTAEILMTSDSSSQRGKTNGLCGNDSNLPTTHKRSRTSDMFTEYGRTRSLGQHKTHPPYYGFDVTDLTSYDFEAILGAVCLLSGRTAPRPQASPTLIEASRFQPHQ